MRRDDERRDGGQAEWFCAPVELVPSTVERLVDGVQRWVVVHRGSRPVMACVGGLASG